MKINVVLERKTQTCRLSIQKTDYTSIYVHSGSLLVNGDCDHKQNILNSITCLMCM